MIAAGVRRLPPRAKNCRKKKYAGTRTSCDRRLRRRRKRAKRGRRRAPGLPPAAGLRVPSLQPRRSPPRGRPRTGATRVHTEASARGRRRSAACDRRPRPSRPARSRPARSRPQRPSSPPSPLYGRRPRAPPATRSSPRRNLEASDAHACAKNGRAGARGTQRVHHDARCRAEGGGRKPPSAISLKMGTWKQKDQTATKRISGRCSPLFLFPPWKCFLESFRARPLCPHGWRQKSNSPSPLGDQSPPRLQSRDVVALEDVPMSWRRGSASVRAACRDDTLIDRAAHHAPHLLGGSGPRRALRGLLGLRAQTRPRPPPRSVRFKPAAEGGGRRGPVPIASLRPRRRRPSPTCADVSLDQLGVIDSPSLTSNST